MKTIEKQAYTAGPWNLSMHCRPNGELAGRTYIYSESVLNENHGEYIAECFMTDVSGANARLIAAAPELLAALRVLVDHAQERYPHFESERGQKEIAAALAAIAKAEGNQS